MIFCCEYLLRSKAFLGLSLRRVLLLYKSPLEIGRRSLAWIWSSPAMLVVCHAVNTSLDLERRHLDSRVSSLKKQNFAPRMTDRPSGTYAKQLRRTSGGANAPRSVWRAYGVCTKASIVLIDSCSPRF